MNRLTPVDRSLRRVEFVDRASWPVLAAIVGLAAMTVVVPVAATTQPKLALAALAGVAALVALLTAGPEFCIALAALVGLGLAPFVDPIELSIGGVPNWLIGFAVAAALMLATFAIRALDGARIVAVEPSLLLWLLAALLAYTVIRFAQTAPMEAPSLAAPFIALPLAAVVTFIWLLHEDAVRGVRRVMPLVIAVIAAWGLMYVVGAGGCSVCREWVSTYATNDGLIGGDSRLYTWGQEAFIAFVLLALARALRRPTALWIGLATLGIACTLLQNSRAQLVALFGGIVVLLIWRLRDAKAATRLLLLVLAALGAYAVMTSSVGDHIVAGYRGLSEGSGTGAYRLGVLAEMRPVWSLLGTGVSYRTGDVYNVDLGIPNTITILGWTGAVLQTAAIVVAIGRGLLARSAIGIAFVSVLVMLLLSRPSLPFIETGPGAVAYGLTLGAVASLHVRRQATLQAFASLRRGTVA